MSAADRRPPSPQVAATPAQGATTRPLGVVLMLGSSVVVCVGQLLWKIGAGGALLPLAAGFVLYGMGALLMVVAYRFGELGALQPLLGMSYALSLLLGAVFLHEHVTPGRAVGVVLVVLGVALLARTGRTR